MFQRVLFIKLLLVHYATQSQVEIHANCSDDVSLKCPEFDTGSMDFLSVAWYKVNSHKKQGIIRRIKGVEAPQHYNFTRPATFGEDHSLVLVSLTSEDSGTYECAISANVGGQNKNPKVELTVEECVTQAEVTTAINVLNKTESDLLGHLQVEELPLMWKITGFVAVGFIKIILAIITISVVRAVHNRSSRQRRCKW